MSAISNHLTTAKQLITSGRTIVNTDIESTRKALEGKNPGWGQNNNNSSAQDRGIWDKFREDGEIQQREAKSTRSWERADDQWKQTGYAMERKDWNETTASIEVKDNKPIEDNKTWLDENKYVDASANIAETEIEALQHKDSVVGGAWGNEHHQLEVDALGYETGGDAAISFDKDGLNARASANAEVYLLRAEYEATYGPGYAKAEAFVGGEANIDAEINFNPMNGEVNAGVGGEAFVGGKLEAETGLESDHGKVGVNGGVSYGIGAEFNADVGIKDGKVQAEFDVGATLGLGVDLGFEVEVDAGQIASDVTSNVTDGVTDAAGKGVDAAKELTGWIPKTPW